MKRRARAPLPLVTVALTVGMLAIYGVELAGDGLALCERFGFVPAAPTVASALASLLLHDPSGFGHVAGNAAFLVVFGAIVERAIGPGRFLVLFLAGGLAGAAMHVVVDPSSTTPLVGCSGALFAVLAVAGVLRPPLLGFVVPFAAVNVLHAFGGPGDADVSFGAHIGGFTMGAGVVVLARLRDIDLHRGQRAARAAAA